MFSCLSVQKGCVYARLAATSIIAKVRRWYNERRQIKHNQS